LMLARMAGCLRTRPRAVAMVDPVWFDVAGWRLGGESLVEARPGYICRAMRVALSSAPWPASSSPPWLSLPALTLLEPVAVTPPARRLAPTEPPSSSPSLATTPEGTPLPSTGVGLGDLAPALKLDGLVRARSTWRAQGHPGLGRSRRPGVSRAATS
jgi:hypothetical protein